MDAMMLAAMTTVETGAVVAIAVAVVQGAFRVVERVSGSRRNGDGRHAAAGGGNTEERGRLCREHAERLAVVETSYTALAEGHREVAGKVSSVRGEVLGLRHEMQQVAGKLDDLIGMQRPRGGGADGEPPTGG